MLKKLLSPLLILTIIIGCNQTGNTPKIKTASFINKSKWGWKRTYFYDKDGKVAYTLAGDGSKTVTVATSNADISTTTDSSGKVLRVKMEFKASNGKVDSSIIQQNGQTMNARKYIYDKEGNAVEQRDYELHRGGLLKLNFIIKYGFKDGNITTESFHLMPAVDTLVVLNPVTNKPEQAIQKYNEEEDVSLFDYYYDKLNTNHGNFESKNLVKNKFDLSPKGDTIGVTYFRYGFDNKGRIISDVSFNKDIYDSTSYTYY